MNQYLTDLMAFADLLAACNVIHEEAVYDSEDYDGGLTMNRIAEAHRRLNECESTQENATGHSPGGSQSPTKPETA